MRRFKAIIYDLDGTLLDSMADIADSMNRVLEKAGFPPHPLEAYRYFIGDGMDILVERCIPEKDRSPDVLSTCLTDMRATYGQRWKNKTRPYSGISDLLNHCAARGLKLGILSNKPDEATQKTVDYFLPADSFTAIYGARPDIPKKPDPRGAELIARQMGVEPGECLFLGDMPVDMQTAVAADMYPVGALWGLRTADELMAGGAQMLAVTPTALVEWL